MLVLVVDRRWRELTLLNRLRTVAWVLWRHLDGAVPPPGQGRAGVLRGRVRQTGAPAGGRPALPRRRGQPPVPVRIDQAPGRTGRGPGPGMGPVPALEGCEARRRRFRRAGW